MDKTEKVRKELRRFPQGVNWKNLSERTEIGRTALYEILDELVENGDAYSQDRLWFPKKPSTYYPSEDVKEKTKKAMVDLKGRGYTAVTLNHIASLAGLPPAEIEGIAYTLAPEIGLFIGSKAFVGGHEE
jgi:hypothetical protein